MSTMRESLTAKREAPFFTALRAAVAARDAEAEASLFAALPELPQSRVPFVLAALGDLRTSGGADLIRQAMTAGRQDARCAGLLALTKREGTDALPDVLAALGSSDAELQDYALVCLAVVGDASVWEAVHARFVTLLRRPVGKVQDVEYPGDRAALVCLISWASDRQRELLVDQIRRDWTKIERYRPDLAYWLQRTWPQVRPTAGPADDVSPPSVEPELARLRANPLIADEGLPVTLIDSL
ncbi:hypothetical protein ACFEMC_10580 [Kineococcus sp. DHX-1]|uniref:hypothetical protein n=1 Tax=Kineococcus sp. DHX-1 TaxID=3349638 RepID=UPI0036D34A25